MKKNNNEPDFVRLMTAYDQFMIGSIKGLLEDAEIPYWTNSVQDKDSYMLIISGGNLFGVDIYIPSDRIKEAQEIISAILGYDFDKTELKK